MKVVVCIKQVPDATKVKINPVDNTILRENVESILNPLDLFAIEEALRLREKYSGKVYAVTMGPPQAESILRQAISMGVDEGILLTDKAFAGADTLATSYTLAKCIEKIGPDIVLAGKQAIDGDTGQVGPEIAQHLGISHLTEILKILSVTDNEIIVKKMIETGTVKIRTHFPILLAVLKDINQPRIASLKGKIRAQKTEITPMDAGSIMADPRRIGLMGSPTQVTEISAVENPPGYTKLFEGEAKVAVNGLLLELKNSGVNLNGEGRVS